MITKLDYKALRGFPYVFLGALFVIPAIAVSLCLTSQGIVHSGSTMAYNLMSELIIAFDYLKYLVTMLLFMMLYSLSAPESMPKQMRYAWHCCVFFFATELVTQVFAWLVSLYGKNFITTFLGGAFAILPDLILMLAIYYTADGFRVLCRDMKQQEDAWFYAKAKIIWVLVHGFVTVFTILLYTVCRHVREAYHLTGTEVPKWAGAITSAFAFTLLTVVFAYMEIGLRLFKRIRKNAYDLYLFTYNKGERS